jgi:hypothetical protein
MSNKIISIILILVIVQICINIYFYKRSKNIEKMSNTDEIKSKINEIYQADIQSIRDLAEIAKNLQDDDGIVIPGNINIKGNINCNGEINSEKIISGKGFYASNNNSWLGNNDGKNYFKGTNILDGTITSDINLNGNLNLNDSSKKIKINNDVIIENTGAKLGSAFVGSSPHTGYAQFSHYDMKNNTKGYAIIQHKSGNETIVNSKNNIRLRKNNNDTQSNVISGKISCENISPTIIEPKINIKRWDNETEVSNAIRNNGAREGVIYPVKFCRLGNHRNLAGFAAYNIRNDGWRYYHATDLGHIQRWGRYIYNGNHSRGSGFDVNNNSC